MDGRFRWTQNFVDGAVFAVVALSQAVSLESFHRYVKEPGYAWLGTERYGSSPSCSIATSFFTPTLVGGTTGGTSGGFTPCPVVSDFASETVFPSFESALRFANLILLVGIFLHRHIAISLHALAGCAGNARTWAADPGRHASTRSTSLSSVFPPLLANTGIVGFFQGFSRW